MINTGFFRGVQWNPHNWYLRKGGIDMQGLMNIQSSNKFYIPQFSLGGQTSGANLTLDTTKYKKLTISKAFSYTLYIQDVDTSEYIFKQALPESTGYTISNVTVDVSTHNKIQIQISNVGNGWNCYVNDITLT